MTSVSDICDQNLVNKFSIKINLVNKFSININLVNKFSK